MTEPIDLKGQGVRLVDVFVIGPLMIWGGAKAKGEPLGTLLALAGIGTIVYNGINYHRYAAMERARAELRARIDQE